MNSTDQRSLSGRINGLLGDLLKHGRISQAEADVVTDLLWHPDLPEFFRRQESAPAQKRELPSSVISGGPIETRPEPLRSAA